MCCGEFVSHCSIVRAAIKKPEVVIPSQNEQLSTELLAARFIQQPILADLIAKGKSDRNRRPWLGIAAQEIQGRLFVARVQENSPGWNAGVRQGDMLLGVDGVPVSGLADYYRKVWALGDPGVDVPLLVLRGNEPTKFDVKSIDRYDWLKLKPTY